MSVYPFFAEKFSLFYEDLSRLYIKSVLELYKWQNFVRI